MDYRIIRSRRKTITIEITPRGDLLVRAPLRTSQRDIQRFVAEKQHWIATHLAKLPPVIPMTAEEHHALIRSAKEFLPQRVAFYARQIGVTYGRITVRSQHRRWGSCSASGNLNFNCLLMLMPPDVRDYVIVHELCHRKQMNHSPKFWSEVAQIFPSYPEQRRWLSQHGISLLARLPDVQK